MTRTRVPRITLTCEWCSKTYELRAKEIAGGKGRFCSQTCNGKSFSVGDRNRNWSGGRIVAHNGYVYIKSPDHPNKDSRGYVSEHRLVMEASIGRYLKDTEEVHHLDKNRENNSIGNLELFKSHSEHIIKYHRDNGFKTRFVKKEISYA